MLVLPGDVQGTAAACRCHQKHLHRCLWFLGLAALPCLMRCFAILVVLLMMMMISVMVQVMFKRCNCLLLLLLMPASIVVNLCACLAALLL
jgi:uncharacterized membrane protein